MERRELAARIVEHVAGWPYPDQGPGMVQRLAEDVLTARENVLWLAGERTVDRGRLEAFLVGMAAEARPMRGAIYDGLLARLRRGDFDEEQEQ